MIDTGLLEVLTSTGLGGSRGSPSSAQPSTGACAHVHRSSLHQSFHCTLEKGTSDAPWCEAGLGSHFVLGTAFAPCAGTPAPPNGHLGQGRSHARRVVDQFSVAGESQNRQRRRRCPAEGNVYPERAGLPECPKPSPACSRWPRRHPRCAQAARRATLARGLGSAHDSSLCTFTCTTGRVHGLPTLTHMISADAYRPVPGSGLIDTAHGRPWSTALYVSDLVA